jgi:hypothetical protein
METLTKGETMNHEELANLAFKLPELSDYDFDTLDALPDSKLRELLGIPEPVARAQSIERKPRQKKPQIRKPERLEFELVERGGCLMRRETWRNFAADGSATVRDLFIPCGARVLWNGRTMSAAIVLHYLRTGETVARAPRADKKPFRAVVREGAKTKHLGYFATSEERGAAVLMYKLTQRVREST